MPEQFPVQKNETPRSPEHSVRNEAIMTEKYINEKTVQFRRDLSRLFQEVSDTSDEDKREAIRNAIGGAQIKVARKAVERRENCRAIGERASS